MLLFSQVEIAQEVLTPGTGGDDLGYQVGRGNVQPQESKVARPTSKNQIKSFLGLVGFIPAFPLWPAPSMT